MKDAFVLWVALASGNLLMVIFGKVPVGGSLRIALIFVNIIALIVLIWLKIRRK